MKRKLFQPRRNDLLRPMSLAPRRRSAGLRWGIWAAVLVFTPVLAMAAYQPAAMLGVNNLSDLASASTSRTNLGLGTAATQNVGAFFQSANNLSEGTPSTMRTNLGLGSLATQAAGAVAVTGGTIDGTALGGTTRAAVAGTTGNFNGILTTSSGQIIASRVVTAAGAVAMATTDYLVIVNKTSGAATVVNEVASPTTGTIHCVKDGKGDAATNNITFTPNSGNVDGAGTYVMNQNYQAACFVYNGAQWNIL